MLQAALGVLPAELRSLSLCARWRNTWKRLERLEDFECNPLEHLDLSAEVSRLFDEFVSPRTAVLRWRDDSSKVP
jgi:hypothetical protein